MWDFGNSCYLCTLGVAYTNNTVLLCFILIHSVQQKHSLKVFCYFLKTAGNVNVKFYTLITRIYLFTSAKEHVIIFNYDKVIIFSCRPVVISHVHVQQNVCRMKGAQCLRCSLQKTYCHSNNMINDFLKTENSKCPPPAFTHHAFNFFVKFMWEVVN